jgi:hypothetical protein
MSYIPSTSSEGARFVCTGQMIIIVSNRISLASPRFYSLKTSNSKQCEFDSYHSDEMLDSHAQVK